MTEKAEQLANVLDTNPLPRPGDFAVGSAASRAAARAQLENAGQLHRMPQNMIEANRLCWKCHMSQLPWGEPQEQNDPHFDYELEEYKYLNYSPQEHARVGAKMAAGGSQ